MHIHRSLLLLIILLALNIKIQAQEFHGNPNIWHLLIASHELNDKWTVGGEVHMRFDKWNSDWEALILRPFVNYTLSDAAVLSVGYTYIRSYPYGDFPLPAERPEHNIWEQLVLKQKTGQLSIIHRYRWEHRFQGILKDDSNGKIEVDGFDNVNRFRYRLTFKRPLNDKYFVHVFDELMIRMDDRLVNAEFDRNWLFGGVGVHMNSRFTLQLGYFHQYIKNNAARFERHPGLHIIGEFSF